MPRLTRSVPKYRKHKASGQAVVTLSGVDHYLGPHRSTTSIREYDRLVAEWLAAGRQMPVVYDDTANVAVVELAAAFLRHAKSHYLKNGRPTAELSAMKTVLRYLRELYGRTSVAEFRPICLDAIRQKMVQAGNSRGYINQNISRIKHIFKWGVANEIVPETVYRRLATVEGLKRGKTEAPDRDPVLPVDDVIVDATLPHLPHQVADMVRLQRLTGMRPGEVVVMRPCDVNRTKQVWEYRPTDHKMEHRERERTIFIGPQAQVVLRPYLLREATTFCFAPRRLTKEGRYTTCSYRATVHRACTAEGVPKWNVNQLRHSLATDIRSKYGLEAAAAVLGHAKMDVTEIYAEKDLARAAEIMQLMG